MLQARIRKRLGTGPGAHTVDVNLEAAEGITVLFGASGSGKTTILRAVAGVLDPDEGRIALGEWVFFDSAAGIRMPARRRNVGYVFQHHLLFPHMTAEQNALYAARADTGRTARERVRDLFHMLGIEPAAPKLPHQLSGGEQQRVALARALATDPSIMLLDEPLSAVDASTRARLIEEIAGLQEKTRIPFLYVTHNHTEALRLGTSLVLLDQGRVAQQGAPMEVFSAPRTATAARIVGAENVLAGRIQAHEPEEGLTAVEVGPLVIQTALNSLAVGTRVTIGIRSEDILVCREHVTQTSARNVLKGTMRAMHRDVDRVDLVVDCGADLKVGVTPAAVRIMNLEVGTPVFLLFKARAVHILV